MKIKSLFICLAFLFLYSCKEKFSVVGKWKCTNYEMFGDVPPNMIKGAKELATKHVYEFEKGDVFYLTNYEGTRTKGTWKVDEQNKKLEFSLTDDVGDWYTEKFDLEIINNNSIKLKQTTPYNAALTLDRSN